jgi:predicted RNase H-like nuclease (RuvC/YqgF family)
MADNTQSAMFEILKGIQKGIAELAATVAELKMSVSALNVRVERIETKVDQLDARVERLEKHARAERMNNAGMLVLMRGTAGAFEVRLSELEDEVLKLKSASQG